METAAIVFEHDFDEETLAEMKSLRLIRLCLAEKQLANINDTVTQMVRRGLVDKKAQASASKDLTNELKTKIKLLRSRTSEDCKVVYLDEIEFYLKLVENK